MPGGFGAAQEEMALLAEHGACRAGGKGDIDGLVGEGEWPFEDGAGASVEEVSNLSVRVRGFHTNLSKE